MNTLTILPKHFRELEQKLEQFPRYGLDYETTSSHPHPKAALHHDKLRVVGYGLGFPDGSKTYVPMAHIDGGNAPMSEAMTTLEKAVSNPKKEVWAHGLKFEIQASRAIGLEIQNKKRCSLLAQWLLGKGFRGSRGHGLKAAAKEYLGVQMTEWGEVISETKRAHEVSPEVMGPYCGDDSLQTLRLGELWVPEMRELDLIHVFEDLECPFAEVLTHIREVGFAINRDMLLEMHEDFSKEEKRLGDAFYDLVGVSISSNQKISRRLYEELKWWPCKGFKKGASGYYSIDKGHREKLKSRLKEGSPGWAALNLKSKHAQIAKLNSTYTHSLVKAADSNVDGRLRCEFKQHGTDTGRLSSADPSFQNIPSRGDGKIIRDAFIAEEGWVICDADYSGADLVMMAHLSRDPKMLELFNRPNKEDRDLHQLTATECDCPRPTGKVLNLGLIYEMGPETLSGNLKCSFQVAKMIHAKWHTAYPMVRAYHARQHAYVLKHGYVRTITGRVRLLPEVYSKNPRIRAMGLRNAVNTADQGSVADVIKIAMRNLYLEWKERGVLYDYWTKQGKAKIQSQVHDEVICSLRKDFAEEGKNDIQRHMENAVKLRAPMIAEPGLGPTWLSAKV